MAVLEGEKSSPSKGPVEARGGEETKKKFKEKLWLERLWERTLWLERLWERKRRPNAEAFGQKRAFEDREQYYNNYESGGQEKEERDNGQPLMYGGCVGCGL